MHATFLALAPPLAPSYRPREANLKPIYAHILITFGSTAAISKLVLATGMVRDPGEFCVL